VTSSGGTVNLLAFAVFGDVRPGNIVTASSTSACTSTTNTTSSTCYPLPTITSIMQGIQALGAQFAIGTGDYMFTSNSSDVQQQLGYLLQAEQNYKGFIAHTMGNHECTGATASNCPNGNETPNVQGYMSKLIPFSSTPYYSFVVHTSMGDAKFIQVAANAWSSAEQSWLQSALAVPSKYTFVSRHEPPSGSTAPGVSPSDSLMQSANPPVTLKLYGHSHEYNHESTNAVISGNGGAPLTTGSYGYLYVVQRPDGNISVTEYDQGTNSPTETWAVTPTGQATN
jgi:hypothetical protein